MSQPQVAGSGRTPPTRFAPGDGLDRRLLARAEAALADLTPQFLAMVRGELQRMQQALETARTRPESAAAARQAIFAAAHDLRGIGSTFGYPLVSRFAQSLCHYLQGRTVDLAVVQAHFEALSAVIENRVKGGGGPLAHRIGRALEALVTGHTGG